MIPIKEFDLEKRILEISYKNKLSHISSCLTAVHIIDQIYRLKEEDEVFVLSSGHAFLALAVILEKYYGFDAEKLSRKYGTHPKRNLDDKIYFSTGSLGIGIVAAAGFALADRKKNVYCLVSDGECAEPSVYGALEFAEEQKLGNLKIYINHNGYGAYGETNTKIFYQSDSYLHPMIKVVKTNVKHSILQGLQGHYKILTEQEYKDATGI